MQKFKVKRGGSSKDRRRARRFFQRMGATIPACLMVASVSIAPAAVYPPKFLPDQEVKLVSDAYGKSYAGRTVKIVAVNGDTAEVQAPKRKSPLVVKVADLEAKTA